MWKIYLNEPACFTEQMNSRLFNALVFISPTLKHPETNLCKKKKKKKCGIPDCLKLALFSHSQQGATHLIHCSKVYYRRKAPSDALLDVKFLCSDSSTLASGWTDTFNLHCD